MSDVERNLFRYPMSKWQCKKRNKFSFTFSQKCLARIGGSYGPRAPLAANIQNVISATSDKMQSPSMMLLKMIPIVFKGGFA